MNFHQNDWWFFSCGTTTCSSNERSVIPYPNSINCRTHFHKNSIYRIDGCAALPFFRLCCRYLNKNWCAIWDQFRGSLNMSIQWHVNLCYCCCLYWCWFGCWRCRWCCCCYILMKWPHWLNTLKALTMVLITLEHSSSWLHFSAHLIDFRSVSTKFPPSEWNFRLRNAKSYVRCRLYATYTNFGFVCRYIRKCNSCCCDTESVEVLFVHFTNKRKTHKFPNVSERAFETKSVLSDLINSLYISSSIHNWMMTWHNMEKGPLTAVYNFFSLSLSLFPAAAAAAAARPCSAVCVFFLWLGNGHAHRYLLFDNFSPINWRTEYLLWFRLDYTIRILRKSKCKLILERPIIQITFVSLLLCVILNRRRRLKQKIQQQQQT